MSLSELADRGNVSIVEFGGRLGVHDAPCPRCAIWLGRSAAGRCRKVLRVWVEPDFVSFHCVRCGAKGFADKPGARIDPRRLAGQKAEAAARDQAYGVRQRQKARWLWRVARTAPGSLVERYLRSRGITLMPATMSFLAPRKPAHHSAMIVPFGIPREPEPGRLAITEHEVAGTHLTLLKPDGSGKAGTGRDKLMIGPSLGFPLVLAPRNDLLGLAITEGIEDGLTVHQETGLGVWAAGAAARMPALAEAVPDYTETVTIYEHADPAGRRGAAELARLLDRRGIEVFIEGLTA